RRWIGSSALCLSVCTLREPLRRTANCLRIGSVWGKWRNTLGCRLVDQKWLARISHKGLRVVPRVVARAKDDPDAVLAKELSIKLVHDRTVIFRIRFHHRTGNDLSVIPGPVTRVGVGASRARARYPEASGNRSPPTGSCAFCRRGI